MAVVKLPLLVPLRLTPAYISQVLKPPPLDPGRLSRRNNLVMLLCLPALAGGFHGLQLMNSALFAFRSSALTVVLGLSATGAL